MILWDQKGIPHKGWTCLYVDDLDEPDGVCEMCGNRGVRYLHVMTHSDYPEELRVGCVCASKMEDDYEAPRLRERAAVNRGRRLATFMRREWQLRDNGNYTLKYKGAYLTMVPNKYAGECFGVVCRGKWLWWYRRKPMDYNTARRVAFMIYEETAA